MGSGNSIIRVANVTIDLNDYPCSDRGLILPIINEYTWPSWLRGTIYMCGLLYIFLGIAIIADIFMCAIEKITSKVQIIKYPDPNDPNKYIDKEVKVWNDTVANLTLMALGSSSPEILLSVIEICGNNFLAGDLGPGTIVGSAAYNLLVITAICIFAIESPGVRRIKNYKVFLTTAAWSSFAYIWLYLVLVVISPNEVTMWEAVVTLLCFPILVVNSYMAEKNFFFKSTQEAEIKQLVDLSSWQRKKLFEGQSVKADLVLEYLKELGERGDLTEEEKARLVAVKILKQKEKNALHYRINGVRQLTGAKKCEPELPPHLQKILKRSESIADGDVDDEENSVVIKQKHVKDLSENNSKSVVEFAVSSYAVLENEKVCHITIERYGHLDSEISFKVETIDGTAEAGSDYYKIDEIKTMAKHQRYLPLDVIIIDDNQWEPDETFFVKISLLDDRNDVKLGTKAITMVTIINDDEPGEVEFKEPVYVVKESVGVFEIELERKNGVDGDVSVRYKTSDINAIAGKDYEAQEGILELKHGERNKILNISIIDDKSAEKDESFSVELYSPQGGVKLGRVWKCVVTIINDDDLRTLANKMANMVNADLDALSVVKKGYRDQFREAMNVNGGDVDSASKFDYFMHFLAFPWKVAFACVPPPHILGGWLCFWCSLVVIGILTAIVGDMAAIFGCLVGLKDSVTAITFVAMGTSLPDTFASKIAAKNERTADNAIGNVTGSNSVNVFLGLGLPWVFATIYWHFKGLPFTVKAGALTFSVAVYTCCSVVCLTILFMRRYMKVFGRGELGGPKNVKYLTASICICLWVIYIVLSSLQAYGHLPF